MFQLRNNLSQTINTVAPEELHSQHTLFNVSTNCVLCSVLSCCVHIVGSSVPMPLWEITNTILQHAWEHCTQANAPTKHLGVYMPV